MSGVNWLHISDLHILDGDPGWICFKEDLRQFVEKGIIRPDFLVVTGDYRNIEKNETFNVAEEYIRELMELLSLELASDLFLVPGNHDMRPQAKETPQYTGIRGILSNILRAPRDIDVRTNELKKLLPEGLEPWSKKKNEEYWLNIHKRMPKNYLDRLCGVQRNTNEDKNIVNIKCLLDGFKDYNYMAESLISWYREGGIMPAAAHCRVWENGMGMRLNIVHLNTALVSDGSRCHYQALDLHGTLEDVFKEIKNSLPTLILAHNSYYDLHPEIQKYLLTSMEEANTCAWLCGDSHRSSMKTKIQCSKNTNSIPIYVCSKMATDNSDEYSENGFFYYEWNGQEVNVTYYPWDLSGVDKSGEAHSKFYVRMQKREQDMPDEMVTEQQRKKLYIGYLSCNPGIRFHEKYHLGHAYFIHKIDQLCCHHNHVIIFTSSYILSTNRTTESMKRDEQYTSDMIQMWRNCFEEKVEVVDVKKYIERCTFMDSNSQQLFNYVSDMELRLDEDSKIRDIIEKWHQTGMVRDSEYSYIMDEIQVGHQNTYKKEEILSFVYLLYKRPVWYNNTWLVSFIYFWNTRMYSYVRNDLGIDVQPNEIVIIESERNNYVWNAISYCAKRFAYINFPEVEYFDNLMDMDCSRPMKSSNKQKTFFLKDFREDKSYNGEYEKYIQQMFETGDSLDKIAEKYYNRLQLDSYEN